MNKQQEALKLALEALEVATTPLAKDRQEVLRAIAAIREALAEQEQRWAEFNETTKKNIEHAEWYLSTHPAQQQEPVDLEAVYETIIRWDIGGGKRSRRELARRIVALYTSPPASKPWVGLVMGELPEDGHNNDFLRGAVWAEAKLKDKNGY